MILTGYWDMWTLQKGGGGGGYGCATNSNDETDLVHI